MQAYQHGDADRPGYDPREAALLDPATEKSRNTDQKCMVEKYMSGSDIQHKGLNSFGRSK